jgi:transcriptional regulator GlxA family with amidase domain
MSAPTATVDPSAHLRPTRHQIVSKIEEFLRDHAGEAISLSQLCAATGVSERSLRNACYAICGTSPKRYLVRCRLEAVHRALAVARPGQVTVTRIATDHGFFELGRFAAIYTALFGESPSQTLRAVSAAASIESAA